MTTPGTGIYRTSGPLSALLAEAPFKIVSTVTALPHVLHARPQVRPVVRQFRGGVEPLLQKYLRYGRQLARANHLARQLGLHRGPPRRILDLGSGPSYFPFVCARMGHRVAALDVDRTPLYNELSRALNVPRVVHEIRYGVPLPDMGGRFDLITAQLICFNGHKNKGCSLWDVREWAWFVDQLRGMVPPSGGRVVLIFVREPSGVAISDTLRAWFARQGARFDATGVRVDLRLGSRGAAVHAPGDQRPSVPSRGCVTVG